MTAEQFQLRLPDGIRQITLDQLGQVAQTIETSPAPTVVFFHGTIGMEAASCQIEEYLQAVKPSVDVCLVYDYQLISPEGILLPTGAVVIMVLRELSETTMGQILSGVSRQGDAIRWVLLRPQWPTIRGSQVLGRWTENQGANRFELDPTTVPEDKRRGIPEQAFVE